MGSSLLASEMEVCLKGKERLDQIRSERMRKIIHIRRIGKQEEEDHHNIKGRSNKRSREGRKVRDRWVE